MAGEMLADMRTGRNGRHALVGLLRQSVFARLAGYEDVNDAERLRHDPAMRWIVGGKAALGAAASPSQMGRFETRWLTAQKNLAARASGTGTMPAPAITRCRVQPVWPELNTARTARC
jgi:Transposase DDE domain group 1